MKILNRSGLSNGHWIALFSCCLASSTPTTESQGTGVTSTAPMPPEKDEEGTSFNAARRTFGGT